MRSILSLFLPALLLLLSIGAAASDDPLASVPTPWPKFLAVQDSEDAPVAAATLPFSHDTPRAFTDALIAGRLAYDGQRLQGQTVAQWPDGAPRKMILRWLKSSSDFNGTGFQLSDEPRDAGWTFGYTKVESTEGQLPWIMTTRNLPLDQTEYEMDRLDLKHDGHSIGLRLGIRTDKRVYWWQFVRADFLQQGPVFDLIRAGGPIYNEQYTVQGDLYLVLWANGTIEAYPHFISHIREGEGMDVTGVPVVGLDIEGSPEVNETLDGTKAEFALADYHLDLDYSVHMADRDRPGSLKTEDGVVVLQPWLDQQISGGLLVDDEGVPEHRILRKGGTTKDVGDKNNLGNADRYFITTVGDKTIPEGMARSFRFQIGYGAAPAIARYQAPAWWHAASDGLPTKGLLPTSWWAVPHALKAAESYFGPDANVGPFEYGRRSQDGDGTLGASMYTLAHATDNVPLYREALPACYWRADIPIHHTDFTISEIPFYGWQWIVQPYTRFMSAVHGYWETGDPYLLETSELAGDGYYRFFITNRPHRSVGRDALPVYDLMDLYRTTGSDATLKRIRHILAEARRSYDQPDVYTPGHQSGAGPNGVGRRPNFIYIPALLGRLHVDLLDLAKDSLSEDERKASIEFVRYCTELLEEKWQGDDLDWVTYSGALLYSTLPALADAYPAKAAEYEELLNKYNDRFNMPEAHGGGRAYCWVSGAIRFDSWAWGATWDGESIHITPRLTVLNNERAPKSAIFLTPMGPANVEFVDGKVQVPGGQSVPIVVH